MIFVNFKTYQEATGTRAVELVRILSLCQSQTKIPIIPVVQAMDIRSSMIATDYNIWAQHIDGVEQGQTTGWITAPAVSQAGAVGTFLNHSEHKLLDKELTAAFAQAAAMALDTLIFAADIPELKKVMKLAPTYMAYEPPELIAAKDTSVSRAKPQVIAEAVKIAQAANIPLIVGAGVKTAADVKKSLELGAAGVAVSSAVVLADDPKKAILELAKGFKPSLA
ncbi:triose-phosphate isomerase [Candidatus Microgenomates bacterium]|nr:triose-phosphate isomerase [Candidatus Microgenomates bacterium]